MKFPWGFSYVTHYMKHSLQGTRRVIILSIIARNLFVIRNKQSMTIVTNRMCICRDDNCVNSMCFPRQLPAAARNLLSWLSSTGVIRVVLSVSYLLVSYFVVNFFIRIFSVCHSFRSMWKYLSLAKRIRQLWRFPSEKVMLELVILFNITQESFLLNLSMRWLALMRMCACRVRDNLIGIAKYS